MLAEFFLWWYGKGWREAATHSLGLLKKVQLSFSIPQLLEGLFAPWRQIISPPGRSIDEKFRSLIDNLVSRAVGFFMRSFALLAAFILMIGAAITGLAVTMAWPAVPLLIIYCIFRGITG